MPGAHPHEQRLAPSDDARFVPCAIRNRHSDVVKGIVEAEARPRLRVPDRWIRRSEVDDVVRALEHAGPNPRVEPLIEPAMGARYRVSHFDLIDGRERSASRAAELKLQSSPSLVGAQ
jgi:hypothetical protein